MFQKGGAVDKTGGVKCTKQQRVAAGFAAYTAGIVWIQFRDKIPNFPLFFEGTPKDYSNHSQIKLVCLFMKVAFFMS